MYWFVSRLTKSKEVGVLAAILYMLMPYHLNDMYIRNALGEFLSYIFIPLVFLGVYKIFEKEKGIGILCVGTVRFDFDAYFDDIVNSDYGWYICMCQYCKIKR